METSERMAFRMRKRLRTKSDAFVSKRRPEARFRAGEDRVARIRRIYFRSSEARAVSCAAKSAHGLRRWIDMVAVACRRPARSLRSARCSGVHVRSAKRTAEGQRTTYRKFDCVHQWHGFRLGREVD